ncbi:DUF7670 domain-containing protein [Carboxylicivirga marina]|uniref:DUF7670 domain-containing protein n=1 Tax=Carboxylicivirga marina TaxID=2800988 RepID=UPI00259167D1|nr:hypothetical protein [uncultured Carboxylicivirga sp.]
MKTGIKFLHWTPRIICILAIMFISVFALDSFNPDLTIWQQIGDFLIHLIPSFVLIILLIVAWKWEFIGGVIFSLIGLGFSPFIFIHNYNMISTMHEIDQSIWLSLRTVFIINVPFVIVGILFIVSHYKKKKNLSSTNDKPAHINGL